MNIHEKRGVDTSAVNIHEKRGVDIQPCENGSWKFKSVSNPDQYYIVEKVASTCPAACNLHCNAVYICLLVPAWMP